MELTFADVLEIYNGRNQRQVENLAGKYPIYGSGGVMGYADDYICPENTVVIGRKGSINKPIFVTTPFWNVDTAFGLVAKPGILLPKYLYYFCEWFDFEKLNTTVTIPSLTKANLLQIHIHLPSMEDQWKIVQKFEAVESLISHRQDEIHALDQLIKARFVELFGDPEINPMGWRVEKLGALLSVEPQNGLYKPQSDYVQDGTGTPILRIDAFYEGKVTSFSGLKRLACTDTERMRYLLHENDIVINRVNSIEYLGKCAWITGMIEPTVFESNMMRFHVDESQVDPCYLTRLLCSTYMYNQILHRAKKAVNQASINQGDVQSFLIVVPPIGLQKSFATFVSQVDKSKLSIQASLDQLETLKQSLMQKYFG